MQVIDAARLDKAIADRHMTYAGVSRYAGLKSRSFVKMLATGERRTCTPRTAKAIAEALGVPVSDLFVPPVSSIGGHEHGSSRTRRAA